MNSGPEARVVAHDEAVTITQLDRIVRHFEQNLTEVFDVEFAYDRQSEKLTLSALPTNGSARLAQTALIEAIKAAKQKHPSEAA